ncbi:7-carboxy-7-deazaguanine synthase QueE [Neorhodopirellula pilleata]|uniref:7-carboxy-7-deazaguanine synthase QueE n=1 Tax=Neorhodopirellula pilleata TaxID=2714738 RepID=UPI001E4AF307|nr:7-carboxy-7-deazaguanine synthase QueE [Neorhodopirellula pilleata]
MSSSDSAFADASSFADDSATLRIAETFASRQGEGLLTGTPSFFIRTSGCNLRCWFCDTPYASWNPEGQRRSIESLVDEARTARVAGSDEPISHVVLTGGEPLVAAGIGDLADQLRAGGFHVTIETAGTVDVAIGCDLLSLSPKLSASTPDPAEHPGWAIKHEQRRLPVETMRRLIERAPSFQVKFVVDSPDEFEEIESVVKSLTVESSAVWIMPQGVTNDQLDAAAPWLRPWCEAHGYRYCDRMQIRWYGNRRGT